MASFVWNGNGLSGGSSGGGSGSVYWLDGAANFAALPAGATVGEVRQTLDDTKLYRWDGAAWQVYYTPGGASAGRQVTAAWITADGVAKTITHNWNTRNVRVEVIDSTASYATVVVDVTRPTVNSVVLTSSEAPGTSWTVLLSEVLN